jgi:hypothetical protein
MDQCVKILVDQGETRRLEEELEKDAVLHWLYSTYKANTLSRKLLKGWETSKYDEK